MDDRELAQRLTNIEMGIRLLIERLIGVDTDNEEEGKIREIKER